MQPGITTGATLGFSAKTDYGLVALMELAGEYLSGGVLQVAEIAGRQAIPERYLEQMMTRLRRAGILVRSMAGKPLIDGSLRVSLGTTAQMQQFWQAYARIEGLLPSV